MRVLETVRELHALADAERAAGRRIALVPTMGALHAGHLALCELARGRADRVWVSIFVNPAQFDDADDLARYPRPLASDLARCRAAGVDAVFAPPVSEIYPPGSQTFVEVTELARDLCGASRPGHFRGVCTVVLKLFTIVGPDLAYFGQKDAQQAIILRKMVDDLNVPVELRVCPTIRESDGLALSSRNQYLNAEERRRAIVLIESLRAARDRIVAGERDGTVIREMLAERIRKTPGAALDYAAVVSAETLQPLERLEGKVLLAVAVRLGPARLIDNLLLQVSDASAEETSL